MEPLDATAYLAAPDFEGQLLSELRDVLSVHGRLALARGPRQQAFWAQNVWLRPALLRIRSVTDGARQLRAIQRNWALYSFQLHRRAALIQDQLPHVAAKPLEFPAPPPKAPLGSWTLLEEDLILASPECSSSFPNGEPRFAEHRKGPPSRAYLKLWEAFTLLGKHPGPGDRCLDAGSSPGSWAWALARLGAEVLAVDRAPLDPSVASLPGVRYQKGSAFSLRPPREGPFDWILSDVVCYPERLWKWVSAWLSAGSCGNFICTMKFQGKFQGNPHYGIAREFASVPGSRVVHLSANKHELTWMLAAGSLRPPPPFPEGPGGQR